MWVDSHCHVHYSPLGINDIQDAIDNGVEHMLCVGTQVSDYKILKSFKDAYPDNISISLGEHPMNENLEIVNWIAFEKLAAKCDAIGETGFDSSADILMQQIAFEKQAAIAIKHNLPVILHTRDMEDMTMHELKNLPKLKGVFHCFTGSKKLAQFAIDNGWFISFSGIITFKNAQDLLEVLKMVPKELLLIETDSPYLAPNPVRGKTNYPKNVKYIGEFVADYLKMDIKEFASITRNNFNRFIRRA